MSDVPRAMDTVDLRRVLVKLRFAPPLKRARTAEGHEVKNARDWEAEEIILAKLEKLMDQFLTWQVIRRWHDEPGRRNSLIKIQDLYEQLPRAVANLNDPVASAAFAAVAWEDMIDKEITARIDEAKSYMRMCDQMLSTWETAKLERAATVVELEALGERVLKRPRH